jgi:hypothetical protein
LTLRSAAIAVGMLAVACQPSTGPSSSQSTGLSGQWSGTTAQGRPIAFTISSDETVTNITLGHEFNGCSGSQTFSSLSLPTKPTVECIPAPCPSIITSYRDFHYATGNPFEGQATEVHGLLLGRTAEGSVNFRNFAGCGSVIGVSWTATKR